MLCYNENKEYCFTAKSIVQRNIHSEFFQCYIIFKKLHSDFKTNKYCELNIDVK